MTDSLLHFMMNYFFILRTLETKTNAVVLDRVFWPLSFPVCWPIYLNAFVFKGYNPRVSKEHRKPG